MRLFDVFRGIVSIGPEEARKKIAAAEPGKVVLLDVREPAEYERGHIPGAVHIPLSRLPDRLEEIDPSKPHIVY